MEAVTEHFHGERPEGLAHVAQLFGRLLATRYRVNVQRGRQIPLPPKLRTDIIYNEEEGEELRRFVTIIAMGSSIEIWNPRAWERYLADAPLTFWTVFDTLAGASEAKN